MTVCVSARKPQKKKEERSLFHNYVAIGIRRLCRHRLGGPKALLAVDHLRLIASPTRPTASHPGGNRRLGRRAANSFRRWLGGRLPGAIPRLARVPTVQI